MRIHHLNCISTCPLGGHLMDGRSESFLQRGHLDDFPQATVHLMKTERDYAISQKTWLDRQRFRPQQWSTQHSWRVYEADAGEKWLGFDRVRALEGVPDQLLMVPLIGHTFGHAGVAIAQENQWLLLAGDAYFYHQEMNVDDPYCTPGLHLYQTMMEKDRGARLENQKRLRALRQDRFAEVEIFCSHDLIEFEKLSGRSAAVPAEYVQVESPSGLTRLAS